MHSKASRGFRSLSSSRLTLKTAPLPFVYYTPPFSFMTGLDQGRLHHWPCCFLISGRCGLPLGYSLAGDPSNPIALLMPSRQLRSYNTSSQAERGHCSPGTHTPGRRGPPAVLGSAGFGPNTLVAAAHPHATRCSNSLFRYGTTCSRRYGTTSVWLRASVKARGTQSVPWNALGMSGRVHAAPYAMIRPIPDEAMCSMPGFPSSCAQMHCCLPMHMLSCNQVLPVANLPFVLSCRLMSVCYLAVRALHTPALFSMQGRTASQLLD